MPIDFGQLVIDTAQNLLTKKGAADTTAPKHKESNLEKFMKGKSPTVDLGAAVNPVPSVKSVWLAGLWSKYITKAMDTDNVKRQKAFAKLTGIKVG